MKYNDLTDEGKEEVRQLLKVQLFKYYNEDVHGLLFETALREQNPNVTLFVDLKVVDRIHNSMIEIEESDGSEMANTGEEEDGFAATDVEKKGI